MGDFLGTYSPGDVQILVNGRTLRGVADGSFIEVERNKPEEFTTKTGARGEGTFVENLDKSGTIKFHIKQNATDENTFLHSLLAGKAVFPVQIIRARDYTEKVLSLNSMIKVRPRKSFSQDEETRVWEISCIRIDETDTAA